MSVITKVREWLLTSSVRPWEASTTALANREKIGVIEKPADGYLIQDVSNNIEKFLALYDAVKAYQPRLAAGRLPLSAQKKAMIAALAALDL